MDRESILKWYEYMGVKNNNLPKNNENSSINNIDFISNNNEIQTKTSNEIDKKDINFLIENSNNLEELKEILLNFEGCFLKKTATNTVFGEGNINSSIMFLGEAPGAQEDLMGRPFCGDSGKLFDLILKSINLDRNKNCYITNSVFWRPPANRKPTLEEINICRPFVEKLIELFQPKLLILVGSTSVESVLKIKVPMSQIRKKILIYQSKKLGEIKTIAIFHPSYLLRQPSQKKEMWSDLMFIKDIIKNDGIEI